MDAANSFPRWARQILIGLGLFVAGGAITFGYSWRPLHGGLTWKVEQLESRLDARNRENLALSDELERLQSSEQTRIDPDTLAQVERELAKTQSALQKLEKKLEGSERKRKDANKSAARWRKRYEEAQESVALRAAPETDTAAPSVAEAGPPATAPTSEPGSATGAMRADPAAPDPPAAAATDTRSRSGPERGMLLDPERNDPSTP